MTKTLVGQIEKYFEALGPRTVKGRAGKDQTDLEGDQLPPSGCVPQIGDVPLLDSHDPTKVLGRAAFRVVGDELLVTATFAREGIDPNIDTKCALAKDGTITGLSVGVTPIKSQPIKGTFGKRYTAFRIHEISLVAIPALPVAHITQRAHAAERAERRAKAERAQRMQRALDVRLAGQPTSAQSTPSRVDGPPLTREQRVAKARAYARKGMTHAERRVDETALGSIARDRAQRELQAARSSAARMLTYPSREERLERARLLAAKDRPAGF